MGRKTLLLVSPHKPEAIDVAEAVGRSIANYGTLLGSLPADSSPVPDIAAEADVLVVFGGDGTLMSQARRFAHLGVPMLGVNMGRLGFLAEFDASAIMAQIPSIFGDGPLPIRTFSAIRAEILSTTGSRPRFVDMAINDAVITAGPPYRLISLSLSIDGAPGPTIRGDGLIISTPLGSTAYNLAAGGPIVAPEVEAFVITSVAAQSLAFRPVVIASSSVIEITMHRVNEDVPGAGTALVLDGQTHVRISEGDRIRLSRDTPILRFIQNPMTTYWSRLLGKMNWAVAPRLS